MHCHLPFRLTHVSAQRSFVSTDLPVPSPPLPVHRPVAIAVSPWTVTLTSLIASADDRDHRNQNRWPIARW
jgi:hypothetical protein